ncbi:MAG: diguanylate cyclase response regulator [Zetaproteobacteria bacterium CG_4_9_14_3_um_filter_53_7]|nr:MAG: diguanylate cyclase response regulator [Zetaproteobacteria bacterium CG_4_9_14_3_um_filter_53_7]
MLDEAGQVEAELQLLVPKPYRILVVDDQAFIGRVIGLMLASADDLELHHCESATDALQMAYEIRPAVILQDLVMPRMDGLTLVRQYRAAECTKHIPVVVLSSNEEAKTKADAFAAGANDYLVKLPDKIELLARLRYHIRAYVKYLEAELLLRELRRVSSMDGLTGLANRRCFDETIDYEWKRSTREKTPVSLLMVDVDHFKAFNDHYGHQVGDHCLRKVAAAIAGSAMRAADLAARYGGEEFVVILANTDESGALKTARTILQSVCSLAVDHKQSSTANVVTVSIGVATMIPEHPSTPEILIRSADKALYRAKESGRNRVVGQ